MTKDEVLDAVRSIHIITRETSLTIIGSQSLHGTAPDRADALMLSREVDMILHTKAGMANWVSEVVGEGTPFEQDRGYFIDHVLEREGLPILAPGWESRCLALDSGMPVIARCLSVEDMVVSKLGAGRPKDIEYVARLSKTSLVDMAKVRQLATTVQHPYQQRVLNSLDQVKHHSPDDPAKQKKNAGPSF